MIVEIVALIALGIVAGALASALGIGGGIIFVPAFVSLFGFSQLEAQGTSLAIIVGTSIVATVGHARKGRIDWKIAAFVGIGSITGAVLGSRTAFFLDEDVLRRIFAAMLVVLAVRMAWHAWSVRPSAPADGSGDDTAAQEA